MGRNISVPSARRLTDAELRAWAPNGYCDHGAGCTNGCTPEDLHVGEILRHLKHKDYPVIGTNKWGKQLATPDHHIVTLSPKEKEKLEGKYAEASKADYIAGVVISTKPPSGIKKWRIFNFRAPAEPKPYVELFQVEGTIDGTRWFPRHFNNKRKKNGGTKQTYVGVEEPKLFHKKTLHKMPWKDQARAKLEDDSLRRLLDKIYKICHWRSPPVRIPYPLYKC